MKKFASLILALAMTFSMCISANAASSDTLNNSKLTSDAQNVTVSVLSGTNTGTVYHVVVDWTDLTFTYQAAGEGTWQPESHTYTGATTNGWVDGSGDTITREGVITVTNHSNAQVNIAATAEDVVSGYTITFTEKSSKTTLPSADNDSYRGSAANLNHDDLKAVYDITVVTAGIPTAGVAAKAKVTISQYTP